MPRHASGSPYSPALDGLRAVSVFAVMAHHRYAFAPGGFIGVDVFFALSGFLITRLLLQELQQGGRVSLRRFYVHRVVRLYPALIVAVLFAGLVWRLSPADPRGWTWGRSASAALFYYGNFVWPHMRVLAHTWSLSIEEQFYLVWPLGLWALHSPRKAWMLIAAPLAVILCALCLRAGLYDAAQPALSAERLYGLTPARADSLMTGALVAVVLALRPQGAFAALMRRPGWAEALLAAFVVAIATLNWEFAWLYRWGFTAIAALSALLVAALVAADGERGVARLLSSAPLRELGRRAYGIYLYHLPMFQLVDAMSGRLHLSPLAADLACLVLTLVVAAASFRWLETPLMQARDRLSAALAPARLRSVGGD